MILYDDKEHWMVFHKDINLTKTEIPIKIVHLCHTYFLRGPGNLFHNGYDVSSKFKCDYCYEAAPSAAEAVYHIARMSV